MIGFIGMLHLIAHIIKVALMVGLFGAGLSIAVFLGFTIAALPFFLMELFCGDVK